MSSATVVIETVAEDFLINQERGAYMDDPGGPKPRCSNGSFVKCFPHKGMSMYITP